MNSAEEAGGTAYGISGRHIIDSEMYMALKDILRSTAEWVNDTAGMFLGHVKMSLDAGDLGSVTLNLTDLDTGVEEHGSIDLPSDVQIRFMAAVLDADHGELVKFMEKQFTDNGINFSKGKRNLIELR